MRIVSLLAVVFTALGLGSAARADEGSVADARALASRFYDAFKRGDFATMSESYADDVRFQDPVYGRLPGRTRTMKMWTSLPKVTKDTRIGFDVVGASPLASADGTARTAVDVRWKADYQIGKGPFFRPVHNESTTRLTIEGDKIVGHRDHYSWKKWARQALPIGPLAGCKLVRWGVTKILRATTR